MHLRRFLLFIFFGMVLISGSVSAQRVKPKTPADSIQARVDATPDSTRHGFFHAGKFHSSFHVQFEGDATYIFRQVGAMTGFQVAWVINHKLSFGAKFSIVTSNVKINKYVNSYDTIKPVTAIPIRPVNMNAMFTVGYIFNSAKKVSFEPALGVGWAYIHFTDPKVGWIDQTEPKSEHVTYNYFAINPSVSMIWNATKFFRVGAVVGANGVFGPNYIRLKSYRVGGLYAGVFLRFGTF